MHIELKFYELKLLEKNGNSTWYQRFFQQEGVARLCRCISPRVVMSCTEKL